jgi:hypothetical protein
MAAEKSSPQISALGSAETTGDEDDVIVTSPTLRKRSRKSAMDDFVVEDDRVDYYSSEEEIVTPSKSRKRVQKMRGDDFVVDDDNIEYISSDDKPLAPSKRQKPSHSRASPQRERRRKAELGRLGRLGRL